MKAKLLAILATLKGFLGSLSLKDMMSSLQMKSLLVGVAVGYLGHPLIKLAVDFVMLLIKGLLNI